MNELAENTDYTPIKTWIKQLSGELNERHVNYTTRLFRVYIDWLVNFNYCFSRYLDPEIDKSDLINVLTLNIYLDVFFYDEQFSYQLKNLEEQGARFRDLELANKMNLITGFLHFSDRFNKEMLNDIVSLYNELDMKYNFESGWNISVKEMIIEDVTSLFEEGVITKTTHELVLESL